LDEVEIKSVPLIDDKTGYIVLSHFNKKASNETKEAGRTKKTRCRTLYLTLEIIQEDYE
jgi:hypothetical protein